MKKRNETSISVLRVSVSIADNYLGRISEVVEQSKKAGLKVDHVLDPIGVITGSIESEKIKQLQNVDGIQTIEAEREYKIAPPQSNIQ
jgi:hypothetical protein